MAGFIGHLIGFYFEGAVLGFGLILLFYLIRIYRISQNKLTYLLIFGYAFYFTGIFFSWMAKILLYLYQPIEFTDPFLIQMITRFRMSMIFIIIGNYSFLGFFKKLFMEKLGDNYKRNLIIRKSIEITLLFVLSIPAIITQSETVALIGDVLAFLIALLDTLFFLPYSIRSIQKAKSNESFRKQFYNISLMALFIFNVMVMVLLDRVAMIVGILGTIDGRYSVFYYAIWTSSIISIIFSIRAYVLK